jgi:hypothetical protein
MVEDNREAASPTRSYAHQDIPSAIDGGMNQLTGPIPISFSCLDSVEQLNEIQQEQASNHRTMNTDPPSNSELPPRARGDRCKADRQ